MPRSAGPAHPLHLHDQSGGGWQWAGTSLHVTVRGSALAMLLYMGWAVDGLAARTPLWVGVGLVALLVHELAHAAVANRHAPAVYVEITWLGGLTRWRPHDLLGPGATMVTMVAGPVIGGGLGLVALGVSDAFTGTSIPELLVADVLWIFGAVSVAAAVLDVLPIFPRDGSRVLLLAMRGNPVRRVVRVATVGAVVAAVTTVGVVALTGSLALALLPAILMTTNAWLAVRGENAIAPPVAEATAAGDWLAVRRRILAGCADPADAQEAQTAALARSHFDGAADIGDAALAHGWHTIGFATRTAVARMHLEQDDLAIRRVQDAVAFGADPQALADAEPMLRHLVHRADWPKAGRSRPGHDPFTYAVDLSSARS